MLNNVVLMGRMVRDAELRVTPAGREVASFTLAVERDYADAAGNRDVDFIDCVAWGKGAVFVEKYFGKGSLAAVNGRIQVRKWKDNNGVQRYSSEVLVERTYFADAGKKAKPAEDDSFSGGDYMTSDEMFSPDEDIPF